MIISIDARRKTTTTLDKIQHLFMIKELTKLEIEGTYEKPTANITLIVNTEGFPPTIRKKIRKSVNPLLFNIIP